MSIPPRAADPSSAAALSRSAFNSRSLSSLAFSRGSRTASESYSSSLSSPAALLAALAASFSASLAFSVPFFFGGAAGAAGLGDSSSDEDSSQSLYSITSRSKCTFVDLDRSWNTYSRAALFLIFARPFLHWLYRCLPRRRARGRRSAVIRLFFCTPEESNEPRRSLSYSMNKILILPQSGII